MQSSPAYFSRFICLPSTSTKQLNSLLISCIHPKLFKYLRNHFAPLPTLPIPCVLFILLISSSSPSFSFSFLLDLFLPFYLLAACYFSLLHLLNRVYSRYDTYHDSTRRGESVGALVASVNDTFTRLVSIYSFLNIFCQKNI